VSQNQPDTTESKDPFLDEIHRMKREAVAGKDMPTLIKHLREIEKQYKDRLLQPPDEAGAADSSAA
jgi:hypothetical protein